MCAWSQPQVYARLRDEVLDAEEVRDDADEAVKKVLRQQKRAASRGTTVADADVDRAKAAAAAGQALLTGAEAAKAAAQDVLQAYADRGFAEAGRAV